MMALALSLNCGGDRCWTEGSASFVVRADRDCPSLEYGTALLSDHPLGHQDEQLETLTGETVNPAVRLCWYQTSLPCYGDYYVDVATFVAEAKADRPRVGTWSIVACDDQEMIDGTSSTGECPSTHPSKPTWPLIGFDDVPPQRECRYTSTYSINCSSEGGGCGFGRGVFAPG